MIDYYFFKLIKISVIRSTFWFLGNKNSQNAVFKGKISQNFGCKDKIGPNFGYKVHILVRRVKMCQNVDFSDQNFKVIK